jgi:hypothetical protein
MSARIPSVVEQDGKLSSAGTGAGGISRRTLRNDRSSGHAGRKGVVRRAAVGCQMTWDYTPAGRMQRIDHPMVQLGGFSSRCCRSCRSSVPQKRGRPGMVVVVVVERGTRGTGGCTNAGQAAAADWRGMPDQHRRHALTAGHITPTRRRLAPSDQHHAPASFSLSLPLRIHLMQLA